MEALTTGNFFRAWTTAFTKNDMKPSFTPCSFSKRSLYWLRSVMTACMLTSLKVVSIAAVCWDCTSRSAMRARSRDIGTRCSGRSPSAPRSTAGPEARWGVGAAAGAALAGACGVPSTARSTSSRVTRPPRPVPPIADVSNCFSAAIFRAAGITAGAAAVGAALAAGFASAFGSAFASGFAAACPLPSVSICAITSLLVTVPPSPLMIFTITPESGAGVSSTTLSVSMSTRFSSRFTNSPAFLCQVSSVASATDSESWGTLTSISMALPYSVRPRGGTHRQCQLHQFLLLLVVQRLVTGGRRGGRIPPGVDELLVREHVTLQVVLDAMPRALVARLFLAPHDLGRLLVALDLRLEVLVREGVELSDARNGQVLEA